MPIQTERAHDVGGAQRKSFAEQKKALQKQQQDMFKMLVTASQPNPLDGESGMKPSEMVTTTLAIQNAFHGLEHREEEYKLSEVQMQAFESLKRSVSLNLVGQTRQVEGNQVEFKDRPVHFDYEIPEGGFKEAELLILGPDHNTIAKFQPELRSGMYHFVWDGKDHEAKTVAQGKYSVWLVGANKPDEKIPGKTYIYAPILSVETRDNKAMMMVDMPGKGPQKIPYQNSDGLIIGAKLMAASA